MSSPVAYKYDPIIAVGFIPYYENFMRRSPLQGFKNYINTRGRKGRGLGCSLLFKTGNIPGEAESIFSIADVDDLMKSKNYRGLLLIKGMKAHYSSGKSYDAVCDPLIPAKQAVGFTPYRNPFSLSRYVWKYARGTGHYDKPAIHKSQTQAGFRMAVKLAFRVGLAGRIGGRVTIGHWPAHVWISLGFVFQEHGKCMIYLTSSGIPNQHYRLLTTRIPDPGILKSPLKMDQLKEVDVRNALECDASEMPEFYTESWSMYGTPVC